MTDIASKSVEGPALLTRETAVKASVVGLFLRRYPSGRRFLTPDMHERVIQLKMEHFPPVGERHRAMFIGIVRPTFVAASAPLWQGYVRSVGLLLRITAHDRSAKPPLE